MINITSPVTNNYRSSSFSSSGSYASGSRASGSYVSGSRANGQYSNDPYSNDPRSNGQYSNDPYSNDSRSNGQYSNDSRSNGQYSNDPRSNDSRASGSSASGSHAPQTAEQKAEQHRKEVVDGINNPVSWYHWNKEVSPMDSKAAWQDSQYQAWRNSQTNNSGSYRDGRFTGTGPASGSGQYSNDPHSNGQYSNDPASGSRYVNSQPQTQLPHMPDNWPAR